MLLDFFKLLPLILVAHAAILCGVFFTGGQLLPSVFSPFYEKTNEFSRLFMALLTVFALGNILVVKAYHWFDPALVTPVNVFSMVCGTVLMTVLVFQMKPPLLIIPATLVVAAGCVWVNILLRPH
ncbi:MAG: hypothetical protein EA357_02770 [Micavibrio sp.]|nr:MAG: hypothetical protein EA357_02770 [Micavibrio sp.]